MVRDQDKRTAIDVSVCIANWNCRDLLKNCLQTLTDQAQGVRLETIVVDNGSHDGATDMVRREFPHVHLLCNADNLGYARANNQAASQARGRYLFFLNNDTRLPAGALRSLVEFLDCNPQVGMVGPRLRDDEGQVQVSYRPRPTMTALLHRTFLFRCTGFFRRAYLNYRRLHFDPSTTQRVDVLMGAAVLIRRDRFFDLGGWDEDFQFGGEDMELSYRVNRQAPVVYYPEVEITHLGRASAKQNCVFVTIAVATGLVKYVRKTGCSPAGVGFLKIAYTLDIPLQLLECTLQYGWRRLWRRHAKAEQSLRAVRGLTGFLCHGLLPFWKA